MTGIDLNRAGTPLLEIVSEPDMRSRRGGGGLRQGAARAGALDRHLRRQHAGRQSSAATPTSRCAARAAVRHPARDQEPQLLPLPAAGDRIRSALADRNAARTAAASEQATVLFDPDTGETRMMRTKEDAHDYRYFPDPDLLPLVISCRRLDRKDPIASCRNCRRRSASATSATSALAYRCAASLTQLARRRPIISRRSSDRAGSDNAKLAANWMMGELAGALNSAGLEIGASPVSSAQLAGLLLRIRDGTMSGQDGARRCSTRCGRARARRTRSSRSAD